MARLTRTQKYAELRDRIAQDREESLKTSGLSEYEDKLKKLNEYFNIEPDVNLDNNNQQNITFDRPVEEVKPQVDVKKAQEESMKSLDDILDSMMKTTYVNEPVKEEVKPVEEKPQPVVTPVEVKPQPVVEKPVEKKYVSPTNNKPLMEVISDEVAELSSIIGPTKTIVEEEKPVDAMSAINITVNEPQEKPELKDTLSQPNSFINDVLKEVDAYNRNEGRTTLDKLPDTIVDEVRHPQGLPKAEEEIKTDNDFSNTVTLEIEKVLNEIKNQGAQVEAPIDNTVVYKSAEFESDEAFKNAEVKSEVNEHPVLAKTQEEPVIEIKNINETLSNTFTDANVLDDTIPFVLDKSEIEEEEEEAPSKVLNIILGILIFVLVAVLGVIVYYILVAKGIIG